MTLLHSYDAPSSAQIDHLVPDSRFAGPRFETIVDVSQQVADHLNQMAQEASGLVPGEWVDFTPGLSVSMPLATESVPSPQDQVRLHRKVRLLVDGEVSLPLHDFPRLFSARPSGPKVRRGGPTFFPLSAFPSGTFGQWHSIALYSDDTLIFGPIRRYFHAPGIGPVRTLGDGEGKLILEINSEGSLSGEANILNPGMVVVFLSGAFGDITRVDQVEDNGTRTPLTCELVGKDYVGDTLIFNESVITLARSDVPRMVVEVFFPNKAAGFAAHVGGGHVDSSAFRADATVRWVVRQPKPLSPSR